MCFGNITSNVSEQHARRISQTYTPYLPVNGYDSGLLFRSDQRLWLATPAIITVSLRVLKYVTRCVFEVTRYVIHVTRNLNYVTRFLS